MHAAASPKRPACASCLRPQSACICLWVTPVAHVVEVLILQHGLELTNAKGTARLLHLSLPHSHLATGEVFDGRILLGAPLEPQATPATHGPKYNILLYPDTPHGQVPGLPAPPSMAPDVLRDPSQLRLVVLDGTWRKSRKMLYLNPLLHHMPRLSLAGMPASSYRIRKAHKPDQLSTLEATCAALAQLEGNAEKFQPLLKAFEGFVTQQLGSRGVLRQF
jgi:DTW domain-containing protein YfiP